MRFVKRNCEHVRFVSLCETMTVVLHDLAGNAGRDACGLSVKTVSIPIDDDKGPAHISH